VGYPSATLGLDGNVIAAFALARGQCRWRRTPSLIGGILHSERDFISRAAECSGQKVKYFLPSSVIEGKGSGMVFQRGAVKNICRAISEYENRNNGHLG
jgi:hypothetical protein